MTYRFKALPELYWSVLTAAATVLLIELVSLDPDGVADWRKWAVALGAGIVRAAAGAALDWLRRQMADTAEDPLDRLRAELLALTDAERDRLTADLEQHRRINERMGDV
jgi:hypothetical protein